MKLLLLVLSVFIAGPVLAQEKAPNKSCFTFLKTEFCADKNKGYQIDDMELFHNCREIGGNIRDNKCLVKGSQNQTIQINNRWDRTMTNETEQGPHE